MRAGREYRLRRGASLWTALALLGVLVTLGLSLLWPSGRSEEPPPPVGPKATPAARHATRIVPVIDSPVVRTGMKDPQGHEVTVGCATCHTTRPANRETRVGQALNQFHQGMHGKHGDLACVACHDPGAGYQNLRLADGRSIAFADVMQLCAQCHGPQYRDYQHGAHGGMLGHWDLTRGGRVRNNCAVCHDAHAPKYPRVQPAPGPNDRFLPRPHGEENRHE